MLESVIRADGRQELIDFWDYVVRSASRAELTNDRLVARNLTTDLRLTHPDFATDAVACGAVFDILDVFTQWQAAGSGEWIRGCRPA